MHAKLKLAAGTAALTLLLTPSANAQAQNPGLPLKKAGPLIDKRALAIPGKLPAIRQADPVIPGKKRPRGLPTGPPATRIGRKPADEGDPGYGDITKVAGKECRPLKSTTKVKFEFKGADVKDVVSAISKTMCKNFIVTQKVRSQKFDIISPTPITVAEAWRAFLSALEANDFTIVQAGKYIKIVQATDGTRSPVPLYTDDDDKVPNFDRMVTRIWKVKHASDINAVVNYLNIFKSGKGQIHPFHSTGVIIATDFGSSIGRLEQILEEIDQPGVTEEVHIVAVDFAEATAIAEKLTAVFEPAKATPGKAAAKRTARPIKGQKAPAGADTAGPLSVSKIIPDDRTNSLIIIASPSSFKQIMALKKRLDVPGDDGGGQVHVLRLKHSDAEELASTLSSLATGASAKRPTRTTRARTPAPAVAAGATSAALFSGEVKVTADKATNSLVITSSKRDLESVRRVISQLDVPRFQVFVEAVILEVSMKRDRNLGVSWYGGIPAKIGDRDSPIIFGSNHSELNALQLSANPLGLASLLGLAGAASGPTLQGSENLITGGIPSFGVVLQALQGSNDINVISTPHLLTLDNEEAEIQISEKRPFPAGLSLGGLGNLGSLAGQAGLGGQAGQALGNLGGLGLGSVSINREDVGLTLKLKPQINDDEYVRLEIDQELSDVAGLDQVTQQTITSKRAAKTVVVVRDQDSVVIGGLVRDRESEDESKVPLLGDLPLIGWLFKRQQKLSEKVNLLLIITPYIIRGPQDFRKIYERKMAERKEFVDRFYGATPEYRASIDWTRKIGPLARFRQEYGDEMKKAENGGPGVDGELIIESGAGSQPSTTTGVELTPGDEGGAMPEGEPATPPAEPIKPMTPPIPEDL